MADSNLNIWIKLRDQVSKQIVGVQGRLKTFATSFKNQWLGITASITASIYAIRKAFDIVKLGAQAEQIENSFKLMATAMGENAKEIKRGFEEASGATVNFSNVAGQASALLSQQVKGSDIIKLMEVARIEALKMGTSVEQAFQQISSAITGGFPVTLKRNYGLVVQLSNAFENMAEKTGMSVDEVRKFHQAQALTNEVIKQAKLDMTAFAGATKTNFEYLQSFSAWWLSAKENMGQFFLAGVQFEEVFRKAVLAGLIDMQAKVGEFFSWVYQKIAIAGEFWGKVFHSKTISKIGEDYKRNAQFAQDWADSMKEASKEYLTSVAEIQEIMSKKTREITEEQALAVKIAGKNMAQALNDVKPDVEEALTDMEKMTKNIATSMEANFSNLFFNVLTGKIKSLKDMFLSFSNSIMQAVSQMMAKKFMSTSIMTAIFGSYATGTSYVPRTGIYQLHRGEKVIPEHGVNDRGGDGGGINVTVNQIIQAWDASDVYRNRKALSSAIAEEIRNNSQIRDTMRRYS